MELLFLKRLLTSIHDLAVSEMMITYLWMPLGVLTLLLIVIFVIGNRL